MSPRSNYDRPDPPTQAYHGVYKAPRQSSSIRTRVLPSPSNASSKTLIACRASFRHNDASPIPPTHHHTNFEATREPHTVPSDHACAPTMYFRCPNSHYLISFAPTPQTPHIITDSIRSEESQVAQLDDVHRRDPRNPKSDPDCSLNITKTSHLFKLLTSCPHHQIIWLRRRKVPLLRLALDTEYPPAGSMERTVSQHQAFEAASRCFEAYVSRLTTLNFNPTTLLAHYRVFFRTN